MKKALSLSRRIKIALRSSWRSSCGLMSPERPLIQSVRREAQGGMHPSCIVRDNNIHKWIGQQSPDFNPIYNLWHMLEKNSLTLPSSLEDLGEKLRQFWENYKYEKLIIIKIAKAFRKQSYRQTNDMLECESFVGWQNSSKNTLFQLHWNNHG